MTVTVRSVTASLNTRVTNPSPLNRDGIKLSLHYTKTALKLI